MENKDGWIIGLLVLAVLLSAIALAISGGNKVDEKALSDKIAAQVISKIPVQVIPTAAEIAAEVVIPTAATIEIPEFESDDMVLDLWEDLYADEIEELETEAYNIAVAEFEDDDYAILEEWFKDNEDIEGFDKLKDVDIDDYEVTIIDLGLGEDEDKIAEVFFELDVRYTLEEGVAQRLKMKLDATASVVFEEGDMEDSDVEFTFN